MLCHLSANYIADFFLQWYIGLGGLVREPLGRTTPHPTTASQEQGTGYNNIIIGRHGAGFYKGFFSQGGGDTINGNAITACIARPD